MWSGGGHIHRLELCLNAKIVGWLAIGDIRVPFVFVQKPSQSRRDEILVFTQAMPKEMAKFPVRIDAAVVEALPRYR